MAVPVLINVQMITMRHTRTVGHATVCRFIYVRLFLPVWSTLLL
jgi:hypothetical protein